VTTATTIRLTLVDAQEWPGSTDGRHYRREEWTVTGGEVAPAWIDAVSAQERRAPGWEPSSRFTLYVVDGAVDPRLAGYGGAVWPTAWPTLFTSGPRASVEITDLGLRLREAALRA